MTSTSLMLIALTVGCALALVVIGLRRRPASTGDVVERMGRYATREDFLNVSGGTGDRQQPGRLARGVEQMVKGGSLAERTSSLLSRADVQLTVGEFVVLRFAAAGGGFVLGYLIFASLPLPLRMLAGIVIGLVGYGAPVLYLSIRAKRRVKKFIEQLGDTITLMANSLRAGYSLLQTMEMVARETKDPMGGEFRRVVREVGLGISQEEAMNNLLKRIPSDDLDLLVTAISIQHEVGGNLAQILTIIGHTIRERVRIKGEIAVLTAQQQISGYVVSALPIGLGLLIFLINPSYITAMFVWPWVCMPIGAGVLIVIGFFAMKKITAIEV